MALLVSPLSGLVPNSVLHDLRRLVLGRIADVGMASVDAGLLQQEMRRCGDIVGVDTHMEKHNISGHDSGIATSGDHSKHERSGSSAATQQGTLNEAARPIIQVRNGRLWRYVKFSLIYDGELLSATDKHSRVRNKNEIRFNLARQLRQVYSTADFPRFQLDHATIPDSGRMVRGIGFVPLLTRKMNASCNLSINFMRNEKPGQIVHGGDIDNRLKTLFDALRLPEYASEVLSELMPESENKDDPMPLCFCLLEDDSLITDLSVNTATIMTPLPKGHVRLVIAVEFQPFDFLP